MIPQKQLTMIIWWSEGVFLHRPTGWEDDKVGNGGAWTVTRASQHCENTWVLGKDHY